jgi:hypothetical protein
VPDDWGAQHIASVAVSSGGGAEKLTNGSTADYWESSGAPGSHYILVTLKRPAVLYELGVVVDPSSDSFCPEKLRVLAGADTSSLREAAYFTHDVRALHGPAYLKLAGAGDRPVSVVRVQIEGSGSGSCGRNCRVVGVCVRCGPGRRVDAGNCAVGLGVVRGPDWMWGEQDGGAGRRGMVTEIDGEGWATVVWENGTEAVYRIGKDGCFDLAEDGGGGGEEGKVRRRGMMRVRACESVAIHTHTSDLSLVTRGSFTSVRS